MLPTVAVPIEDRFKRVVRNYFELADVAEVPLTNKFSDYDADSLDAAEFQLVVEDEFQIFITDEQIARIVTLGDWLKEIQLLVPHPAEVLQ